MKETINDLMDDLENEGKLIISDGEAKTIKEVLDKLLTKDKKPRHFSAGG